MSILLAEKGFMLALIALISLTGINTSIAINQANIEDIEIYRVNDNLYQGRINDVVFTAEKSIHIDDIKKGIIEEYVKNNEIKKISKPKKDKPGKIKFTFHSKNGETKIEYEHDNITDLNFDKKYIEEIFRKMEFHQQEIKKKQAKNSLWNKFIDLIEKD